MNKFNNADVKRKSSTKLKEFLKRILKNEEKVENLVARIHGGTEAKVGQFPWMVLVANEAHGWQVSAISHNLNCRVIAQGCLRCSESN